MDLVNKLFDLTGKTAVVTGASSGLGAYFAEILANQGRNGCDHRSSARPARGLVGAN